VTLASGLNLVGILDTIDGVKISTILWLACFVVQCVKLMAYHAKCRHVVFLLIQLGLESLGLVLMLVLWLVVEDGVSKEPGSHFSKSCVHYSGIANLLLAPTRSKS